jgi:hypothetical protein
MKGFKDAITSGADQKAQTPTTLLNIIRNLFFKGKAFFDPCPPNPTFDGLVVKWHRRNYVNPPFRDLPRWIAKAKETEGETVVLMPLRSSARYFHTQIIDDTRTVIVLWLNRVAFPPHRGPLPLPVITAGIHHHTTLRSSPDVTLFPVSMISWDLGTPVYDENDMKKRVRLAYGTRCSFVRVMNSPRDVLIQMTKSLEKNPRQTLVAMVIPTFCSKYFQDIIVPWVVEVVFLCPSLDFGNGRRSFMGSVLLVLSGISPRDSGEHGYFGRWKNGEIIRD